MKFRPPKLRVKSAPIDTVFQPTQTARHDQSRMVIPTDATLPWTTEVYGLLASIGGISVASRFPTLNICTVTRHRQAALDVWAEGWLAAGWDQGSLTRTSQRTREDDPDFQQYRQASLTDIDDDQDRCNRSRIISHITSRRRLYSRLRDKWSRIVLLATRAPAFAMVDDSSPKDPTGEQPRRRQPPWQSQSPEAIAHRKIWRQFPPGYLRPLRPRKEVCRRAKGHDRVQETG